MNLGNMIFRDPILNYSEVLKMTELQSDYLSLPFSVGR